jgi:hypothetical protein
MMSEPKGRGGKKPKYQIADIGGSDLTSEDISTERVLNFLIKGERAADEQSESDAQFDAATGTEPDSTTPPQSAPPADKTTQPDSTISEKPAKKDLSHLFERAGTVSSSPAKDLKLTLSEPEPVPVPSLPPGQQQILTEEQVTEPEAVKAEVSAEAAPPVVEQISESPTSSFPEPQPPLVASSISETFVTEPQSAEGSPPKSVEPSPELAHYMELWKNFYRLKSGEIDVLSNMYLMSHDLGRPECYVKMRKLAEISNLDYRYCQKVVRSLEHLGWVTKLQEYDATTQLGVLYRVNLKPAQIL